MSEQPIAVVTGGNKGIGLAICRRLAEEGARVVLTARDAKRGKAAAAGLEKEGLAVVFHPLNVTDEKSVKALAAFVQKEFGRLDILVNNAAIQLDKGKNIENLPVDVLREMMDTNLYGPLRACQALLPLLKKSGSGRIVNVSSAMGSLAEMGSDLPAYRITKTALNALTCILADDLRGTGILVNCVHPGWVRTDMGGSGAPRSTEEGADTPVWAALLPDDGPTGGFFRDRAPMAW